MGEDDPPTLLQLFFDLNTLWNEWDSTVFSAEKRKCICNRWYLRNIGILNEKIENLSKYFFENFETFEIECRKVKIMTKIVFYEFAWFNAFNDKENDGERALIIFDEEIDKLKEELEEVSAKLLVKVRTRIRTKPVVKLKKKTVMEKAQKEAKVIHDKNSTDEVPANLNEDPSDNIQEDESEQESIESTFDAKAPVEDKKPKDRNPKNVQKESDESTEAPVKKEKTRSPETLKVDVDVVYKPVVKEPENLHLNCMNRKLSQ